MKVLVSLYRVAGIKPVSEIEINIQDIGEMKVNELLNEIKINGSEVYADDTLEITFKDFK